MQPWARLKMEIATKRIAPARILRCRLWSRCLQIQLSLLQFLRKRPDSCWLRSSKLWLPEGAAVVGAVGRKPSPKQPKRPNLSHLGRLRDQTLAALPRLVQRQFSWGRVQHQAPRPKPWTSAVVLGIWRPCWISSQLPAWKQSTPRRSRNACAGLIELEKRSKFLQPPLPKRQQVDQHLQVHHFLKNECHVLLIWEYCWGMLGLSPTVTSCNLNFLEANMTPNFRIWFAMLRDVGFCLDIWKQFGHLLHVLWTHDLTKVNRMNCWIQLIWWMRMHRTVNFYLLQHFLFLFRIYS